MDFTRKEFILASAAVAAAGCVTCGGPEEASGTRRKEGCNMLKGISPVISPELLKTLAEMGHGDEIVISDAHFPAHTMNEKVIRADGHNADKLLAGIIPLFELDAYATPVIMMAPVPGDKLDPSVEARYRKALGYDGKIELVERFAFYERAKKAFAVVISGETAIYGNIILKKGVTPVNS